MVDLTLLALVYVLRAVDAFVAGSARTRIETVDRTGVADRILVARIRRARVLQVTQ